MARLCTVCEEEIPLTRLKHVPSATLCVKCKEQEESLQTVSEELVGYVSRKQLHSWMLRAGSSLSHLRNDTHGVFSEDK